MALAAVRPLDCSNMREQEPVAIVEKSAASSEVISEGRTLRNRTTLRNAKLTCRFSCCTGANQHIKSPEAKTMRMSDSEVENLKSEGAKADERKQSAINQIFISVRATQQPISPSKRNQAPAEPSSPIQMSPKKTTLSEAATSPSTPHKIFVVDLDREAKQKKVLTPSTGLANLKIQPKKDPAKNKVRRKLNPDDAVGSHKLTEYFPVRRSERKPKNMITEIEKYNVEQAVLSEKEEGLEVRTFPEKGRGIVASRCFTKGEYVLEYAGDLIDLADAKQREALYSQDQNLGSYMYYFQYKNVSYCIDATAECGRLGRLVNHSRNGNLITRIIEIKTKPRLILLAKRDIEAGEEVLYDYGDRSKEALTNHPWLAY